MERTRKGLPGFWLGIATAMLRASTALAMPLTAPAAAAQETAGTGSFAIPAQPLSAALVRFGRASGLQIFFDERVVAGHRSPGVSGSMTAEAALARLLAGTELGYRFNNPRTVSILAQTPAAPAAAEPGSILLDTVVIQGEGMGSWDVPPAYAGGQVASGGALGILGNTGVMDTPFNQTSYTSKLIQDQQAATVADVLDNEPSVRRATPAYGSAENVKIRGFDMNVGEAAINGLYGLAPLSGSLPVEFVERVEVLKGPNALLSGITPSGQVGGGINLVMKRAGDEPLARLTMGLDSDSSLRAHVDVGRRLGAQRQWGLRVNGSYRSGETFIDGQSRKVPVGAVGLDYRGGRFRASLDAYHLQEKTEGGIAFYASPAAGLTEMPAAPSGNTNIYPGIRSDYTTQGAVLQAELDIADGVTAYSRLGEQRFRQSGFFGGIAIALAQNGDTAVNVTDWPYESDGSSAEVGVRGAFSTGGVEHRFAVSAARQKRELASSVTFARNPTNIYDPLPITLWPDPAGAPLKTAESTMTSLALVDTMSLFDDRALLTLGIRHQKVRSDSYDTATGLVASSYDSSAWTPMVGLVVKPSEHLSFYGSYIEGLSPGTVVDAAYQNAGQVFAPYKTRQVEIGAKLETGGFINTVSLFQVEKPGTLVDYATAPLPTLRENGEQRNRGIEWAIMGEIAPELRALGGVSYTQARLTRTQDGAHDGNHAPGAAPLAVNLGLEWDTPWVQGLTLSGRLIHTSSQYVDNANAIRIPDWTRVDLGMRYETVLGGRKVSVNGGVKNLFDQSYWAGANASNVVALGAPRTFQLSASVDF